MNKKIIVIILILGFIFTSCESAIALHIEKQINQIKDNYTFLVKECSNEMDFNFNYIFIADGAIHKITNITFIKGASSTINRLNSLFSKKLFFPIFSIVYINNLTFTISFDEPVIEKSDYRYWYDTGYVNTNLSDYDLNVTFNVPHSRTVYNLTGFIIFQRPKIFKLFSMGPKFLVPYRFTLLGYCENIETNIISS